VGEIHSLGEHPKPIFFLDQLPPQRLALRRPVRELKLFDDQGNAGPARLVAAGRAVPARRKDLPGRPGPGLVSAACAASALCSAASASASSREIVASIAGSDVSASWRW
jgi:hypothetical protein